MVMKRIIIIVALHATVFMAFGQQPSVQMDPKTGEISAYNAKYIFNTMSTYDKDLETYTSSRKGAYPVVIKFSKGGPKSLAVIEPEGKTLYKVENVYHDKNFYIFSISERNGRIQMYTAVLSVDGNQAVNVEIYRGVPGIRFDEYESIVFRNDGK